MAESSGDPARIPTIYVNGVSFRGSATDVALLLHTQLPNEDTPPAMIALMAWEQAKVIHVMLGQAIKDYEATTGGAIRDLAEVAKVEPEDATSASDADAGSLPEKK
jgi:hypothetical protein